MGEFQCVICDYWFDEFPNNAQPLTAGPCCDGCNETEVVPYRLELMYDLDNLEMEYEIPLPPIELEFEETEFESMLNDLGLTIINNNNNN